MATLFTTAAVILAAVASQSELPPQAEERTLAPGVVIAHEIRGGESHDYRVDARSGDAIDVRVTQIGIDLVLVIIDPAGATLYEIDSPNGSQGDEKTTIVVDGTSAYRVRVRPFEDSAAGRYEVRVQIRPATVRDRDRAEAEAALRAAPRLLSSGLERDAETSARDLQRGLAKALALDDPMLVRNLAASLMDFDPGSVFSMLDIPVVPGAVPVYYSRGNNDRARSLRDGLAKAIDHFDAVLKVRPPVSLAVLARPDWERLTGTPYGMPFSYPNRSAVIFIPAEHVMFADFLATMLKQEGPAGGVARAAAETGLSNEELARWVGDSTIYHEFGHILAACLGIIQPNRWFGEFLANYVSQASLAELRLDARLLMFLRSFKEQQRGQDVAHRSLEDLERLYAGVGADNYGWYQAQLDARAEDVYKTQGVAFLSRVRAAFPAATPTSLPVADVLSRLEAIAPGFIPWARALAEPPRQ